MKQLSIWQNVFQQTILLEDFTRFVRSVKAYKFNTMSNTHKQRLSSTATVIKL